MKLIYIFLEGAKIITQNDGNMINIYKNIKEYER